MTEGISATTSRKKYHQDEHKITHWASLRRGPAPTPSCHQVVRSGIHNLRNAYLLAMLRPPDDLRLSDIEERFTCRVRGKRGADVRPDFNRDRKPNGGMGYR